ncbi:hypothetical protein TSPI_04203 [Trichinella spiralis]|uniref:Uncharacterized protein n=1 Tax=Trichinella spiralis TaxID=6334 RepID=A0ABR3KD53_TRISP
MSVRTSSELKLHHIPTAIAKSSITSASTPKSTSLNFLMKSGSDDLYILTCVRYCTTLSESHAKLYVFKIL